MVNKKFNFFLTGGKSIQTVYEIWSKSPKFLELNNINFYLGDERCVDLDDAECNSGNINRTLFKYGVPPGCKFISPIIKGISYQEMADRYDSFFPSYIDALLLSVGDDGHIASIFPGERAISEKNKCFVCSNAPTPPFSRLTITLKAIQKSKKIYLLATSKKKIEILQKVKDKCDGYFDLPVSHVIDAQWIASENLTYSANFLLDCILFDNKKNLLVT